MKQSSKRSKPQGLSLPVTDALSLFSESHENPLKTSRTLPLPSEPSQKVSIDGQWFLELRRKHEAGTLTPGDIKELIALAVRLRVAVALLNDEIAKLRGNYGQV